MTTTALDNPGTCHVDRIARDCATRRLPREQTALRLLVASDLAEVLDARTRPKESKA